MNTLPLVFSLADAGRLVRVREHKQIAVIPLDVEGLSFERFPLEDEEVLRLPTFSRLRCLDRDGTRVTDAALEWVSTLSELEELWLEETQVTDIGIQVLRANRKLRLLSVEYTMVTPAGMEALPISAT